MNKRGINIVISLLIGLIIFGFFLYKVGLESIALILSNIKPIYLGFYLIVTTLTFLVTAWRWDIILKTYKKKVSLLSLLKYTIAGYAVAYVTPSVKLGGEPLRAYLLKKEKNINLKTGSSSVILEKFIEFVGTVCFGLVGLILFLSLPQLSFLSKIIFTIIILFAFYILFVFYYRTVTGKGSFSSLFNLFRLYKIPKLKNFIYILEDVEEKLKGFFLKHKKEFWLCLFTYLVYSVLLILEFKLLLLSFGVNESIKTLILAITVKGFVEFIPIPAALGFLEAGQTSLFALLNGEGSVGFALSLLLRVRALLFVAIGFGLIANFSGKQFGGFYRGRHKKNI